MSLQPGLADLEKELGCSICTELLYQPLTLLDCLHTFCGSCLREWFKAQGSRRLPSSSAPRFTCPSCRAEVRGTRPNATVTTLLDMILVAQPDRARTDEEKKEIAERYNPGDSVFPPPREPESSEDEADVRLMNDVRDLSLRESRSQARREARRAGHSERTRDRSNNPSRHADDSRRRRDDSERQQRTARSQNDSERSRRIEHQSSLRSLLSLSSETETMEEEILRQIMEEGLLDDIDLDNLGPRQEEELSERIADAYRRRHMQQSRTRPEQRRRRSPGGTTNPHPRSQSARRSGETNTSSRDSNDRRPPVSRPHLLGSTPSRPNAGHQRRNSEQATDIRRASPVRVNPASNSDDTLRPAVRSASDMTAERPRNSQPVRSRADSAAHRPRRATESDHNISDVWMGGGREPSSSRNPNSSSASSTPVEPPPSSPLVPLRSERRPRPAARSSAHYVEPSISCDVCGKANIQYDLHKRCFKCKDGNFNLCLRCYRAGRGCFQWSGFEVSAQGMFELFIASSNGRPAHISDPGHLLSSFKYQRPPENANSTTNGDRQLTNSNPSRRLESGLFCDICVSSANDCYWKCNKCNDGDWGFCNKCVNQGRCCTHPLLPVRRMSNGPSSPSPSSPSSSATAPAPLGEKESFKILSFSTNCDICTYPIPASVTRFHCLHCNYGDYDVCTNCYLKLVATSKISKENGHSGWRRCIAGHRMIIVGFEDHVEGQRRVIVRNLVGGHALKDEHVTRSPTTSPATSGPIVSPELGLAHWTWKEGQGQERRKKASRMRGALGSLNGSTPHLVDHSNPSSPVSQTPPALRRFPPDGGVGLIVRAKWSFFPEDDVEDELPFPRGADITEVDIINDEWFWGCYAARTGLFYGKYVEVIRSVES